VGRELAGKTKVFGENLLQCHFLHNKSHIHLPTCPGGKPATNRLIYGTVPEPLVPELSPLDAGFATASLEKYKPPGVDQIRQNCVRQQVKYYGLRSVRSFILFGIRKNFLSNGSCFLLYQCTWALKLTVAILALLKCYQHSSLKAKSICTRNDWAYQCELRRNRSTSDQIFSSRQILEKKIGFTMRQYISYSWTSKKPKIEL
jgi:hypothetical protein